MFPTPLASESDQSTRSPPAVLRSTPVAVCTKPFALNVALADALVTVMSALIVMSWP